MALLTLEGVNQGLALVFELRGLGGVVAEDEQAGDEAAAPKAVAAAPTRLPREAYNDALEKMDAGDLDAASTGLEDARARAGGDGQLRSHATYNLGIVEARRADAREASAPEEALSALERAASWFREAVEVDAHDEEARQNLELVLKRALVLADAIERAAVLASAGQRQAQEIGRAHV